jgi:ABC-2 type transport system ATP-binding protein
MTAIQAHGLTKIYGPTRAVDDLSFTLTPGRVTGFLGANGAGKSTTIRMLLGMSRPSSGTATIDGVAYRELRHPLRRVGALVGPDVFHPGRSGREALRVIGRPAGIGAARVDEVLELVDLTSAARRRVGGYSTGMRQRLALAAALLGDPEALILDEPANGLDPEGVHRLRGLMRGLADQGRTVFVSSHLLAELAQSVDDVLIIHRGRALAHEPIGDLLTHTNAATLEDVFLGLTGTAQPAGTARIAGTPRIAGTAGTGTAGPSTAGRIAETSGGPTTGPTSVPLLPLLPPARAMTPVPTDAAAHADNDTTTTEQS